MYLEEISAYLPQSQQEAGDKEMILAYLRQFPHDILTRENKIAHLTSSGFVVNADGTKVLMAHHNLYKVWAWTGGHADGDPDLLAVALREAREATGAGPGRPLGPPHRPLGLLPVGGHVQRGRVVPPQPPLDVPYPLPADVGDPLQIRPEENTRVGWLPADRLLEYTNEWQMDEIYTKLLARARALLKGETQ